MLTEENIGQTAGERYKIIVPHHSISLETQLIAITAGQESLCFPTIETGKHWGNLMTHKSQLLGSTLATSGLSLTPRPYLYRRLNWLYRSAFPPIHDTGWFGFQYFVSQFQLQYRRCLLLLRKRGGTGISKRVPIRLLLLIVFI